jgi:hypothetical protein
VQAGTQLSDRLEKGEIARVEAASRGEAAHIDIYAAEGVGDTGKEARGLLWQADAPYQILPARVGTQVVEHRKRQLDNSEHALLIRLLEPFERGILVA